MDIDEMLSLYLVNLIKEYEQLKNPYQDVENVIITDFKRTKISLSVDYVYDIYSRFDRKWHLIRKPGYITLDDNDLKPYYREIIINQILE